MLVLAQRGRRTLQLFLCLPASSAARAAPSWPKCRYPLSPDNASALGSLRCFSYTPSRAAVGIAPRPVRPTPYKASVLIIFEANLFSQAGKKL